MPRKRTPRVVGVRKKPTPASSLRKQNPRYEPKQKSKREQVYDLIYEASVRGYHFSDKVYGLPFIELSDIEEKGDGIFIIRFRCEPQYLHEVYFGRMAKEVCASLKSGMHFIHEFKMEWGLPYEECVWVLQLGETSTAIPIWKEIFMKQVNSSTSMSPKKCSHERWEEFLHTHYNRSLVSVAKELGYSEQNLDILGCDAKNVDQKKSVYKKYKKLFDSFLKDEWNKSLVDGRNVLDYFKDLISSWIGEDLLVKALNEYGFTASLANADKDRVIKTERREVTGEPDIKVEYEGCTRYIELMDALSPVERYGQFDLRLSKAKNQFARKTIFLLHGLADNKFILIDFMRDNVTVTYNYPNPRFGNKPCSVVKFEDNNIKMQDMAILWEAIKDVLTNAKPEPPHCLKMVDFGSGQVEVLGVPDTDDEDSSSLMAEEEEILEEGDNSVDESSEVREAEEESPESLPENPPGATDDATEGADDAEEPADTVNNDEDSSIIEEDENGQSIEYTPEQWAALNDGF